MSLLPYKLNPSSRWDHNSSVTQSVALSKDVTHFWDAVNLSSVHTGKTQRANIFNLITFETVYSFPWCINALIYTRPWGFFVTLLLWEDIIMPSICLWGFTFVVCRLQNHQDLSHEFWHMASLFYKDVATWYSCSWLLGNNVNNMVALWLKWCYI